MENARAGVEKDEKEWWALPLAVTSQIQDLRSEEALSTRMIILAVIGMITLALSFPRQDLQRPWTIRLLISPPLQTTAAVANALIFLVVDMPSSSGSLGTDTLAVQAAVAGVKLHILNDSTEWPTSDTTALARYLRTSMMHFDSDMVFTSKSSPCVVLVVRY